MVQGADCHNKVGQRISFSSCTAALHLLQLSRYTMIDNTMADT